MARSNGKNGHVPVPPPPWHGDGTHAPQPQGQQGFAPSPDLPPFAPQPPLAGYAPQQGHPNPGRPAAPAAHPHSHLQPNHPQHQQPQPGYDLGHFGVPQQAAYDPHGRTAPPQHALPSHPQGQWTTHDPHFPSPAAFAEPVPTHRQTHVPQGPGHLPHLPPAQMHAHGHAHAQPQPQPQDAYDDEEYDADYEDEEPKRGRKLMVVGALVGAICVGAGLAYAYRAFSGGKMPLVASKTQTQKSAQAPAPKPPVKLPDAVPAQAVAAASAADDGVRRVTSIAIPPPGGAAPPAAGAPTAATPVIPGMVLEPPARPNFAVAPPAPPLRPSAVPTPAPVLPPVAAPQAPAAKVAVLNPPAAPAAQAAPAAAASTAPKKGPVPKAKGNDAFVPGAQASAGGAAPAAPAPAAKSALGAGTPGSNGYVAAVLSTPRGRPEAMKAFADLQQKYPDVLAAKPAEVQEKQIPDKGTWFRAVVGPPGSRSAAAEVCTQLKAAGYAQCFVTAY